jgi:hypothetical protein
MVGNVCLAKINQRLLITNYGSLGAASSFLLRSRSKPILHIRGTHLRSRSKPILREELIYVQGASQFSIYEELIYVGVGGSVDTEKRPNIWWGPKCVPCKTVHQRHSSSRFEMNLENSQKYWITKYFNFFFKFCSNLKWQMCNYCM